MKKYIILLLIVALLTGCQGAPEAPSTNAADGAAMLDTDAGEGSFSTAVWMSYIDLLEIFSNFEEGSYETIAHNLLSAGVDEIYLQVVAFGDALWESEVYPYAGDFTYASAPPPENFLQDFIAAMGESGIAVQAWLNPYRLYYGGNERYSKFLSGFGEQDILYLDGKPYLAPGSDAAVETVCAAIEELLSQYEFSGVQFDDYFYPSNSQEFDGENYRLYLQQGGELQLDDYRRERVNLLVSSVYRTVKSFGEQKLFGVSPDASIERDYSQHYCDVELWCSEDGYIDYICPQIYYGFENETMPFLEVLDRWCSVASGKRLIVGLAFSKVGSEDGYAGSGSGEWLKNGDIILRQMLEAQQRDGCSGVALFRYGSLFFPPEEQAAAAFSELEGIRNYLGGEL